SGAGRRRYQRFFGNLCPHEWISTPKLSRSYPSSRSYHNPCQPIHPPTRLAAFPAMPYERNPTVAFGS
ncbi:hypothetical protein K443DRAFT_110015, partial [Laccaria amethystina LaAM-08-1]